MRYRLGNIHSEVRIWNHYPRCYGLPSRHRSNISLAKINRRRRFFLLKKYLRVLQMIGSGTRSIRIHQRMSTFELHSFCNVALLKLNHPAISACKHSYAEHQPGSTAPSSACPSVWRILGVFRVIPCQAHCQTLEKTISATPVRMLPGGWGITRLPVFARSRLPLQPWAMASACCRLHPLSVWAWACVPKLDLAPSSFGRPRRPGVYQGLR